MSYDLNNMITRIQKITSLSTNPINFKFVLHFFFLRPNILKNKIHFSRMVVGR